MSPENSFNLSSHVMVPLPLFAALSRCYFGSGPRYGEIPSVQLPQPKPLADTRENRENPDAATGEAVVVDTIDPDLTKPNPRWPKIEETDYVKKAKGTWKPPVTPVEPVVKGN